MLYAFVLWVEKSKSVKKQTLKLQIACILSDINGG